MSESNNFKLLLTIDFEEQRRLEKAGFPKEAIDEWGEAEMLNEVRKDYWSHPDAKGLEEKR